MILVPFSVAKVIEQTLEGVEVSAIGMHTLMEVAPEMPWMHLEAAVQVGLAAIVGEGIDTNVLAMRESPKMMSIVLEVVTVRNHM